MSHIRQNQIRKAYDYLNEKAVSGETLTLNELASAAGWKVGNTETNISKRLGEVVDIYPNTGKLIAKLEIAIVPFDQFAHLFSQKNYLFATYKQVVYPDVTLHKQQLIEKSDRLCTILRLTQGYPTLAFSGTPWVRVRSVPGADHAMCK